MGIVAVIVVCLGLQKVVDVLGCAGIIVCRRRRRHLLYLPGSITIPNSATPARIYS